MAEFMSWGILSVDIVVAPIYVSGVVTGGDLLQGFAVVTVLLRSQVTAIHVARVLTSIYLPDGLTIRAGLLRCWFKVVVATRDVIVMVTAVDVPCVAARSNL